MLKEKALNLNVIFYIVTLVFIFTVFFSWPAEGFQQIRRAVRTVLLP